MLNYILIALISFSLTSCSIFSPVKVDETTYELKSIPTSYTKKTTHKITILVTEPEANPAYDTAQIAYTNKPFEIGYFSKNRWAETPTNMMQTLLVQTLENTHYFHAVVSTGYVGQYNYTLNTELLELIQDFTQKPSVVHLKMRAQLIRVASGQVIATQEFSVNEPCAQSTPYGGVIAANAATANMLQKISDFCLKSVRHL